MATFYPTGMVCRACGGEFEVGYTTNSWTDTMNKYLVCRGCGADIYPTSRAQAEIIDQLMDKTTHPNRIWNKKGVRE